MSWKSAGALAERWHVALSLFAKLRTSVLSLSDNVCQPGVSRPSYSRPCQHMGPQAFYSEQEPPAARHGMHPKSEALRFVGAQSR